MRQMKEYHTMLQNEIIKKDILTSHKNMDFRTEYNPACWLDKALVIPFVAVVSLRLGQKEILMITRAHWGRCR